MQWHALIAMQVILMTASTLSLRALARNKATNKASFSLSAVFAVLTLLVGLVVAPFFGHIQYTHAIHYWPWLVGGGILFTLCNVCIYKMFQYFDAGIGSILNTLNTVTTVIFAGLILHEHLSLQQIVGGFVLLSTIVFVIHAEGNPETKRRRKINQAALQHGLFFAITGAVLYGLAIVNEKFLLGHMTASTYYIFGWGGQAVTAVLAASIIQPNAIKVLRKPGVLNLTLFTGITRAVAGVFFIVAQIRSNNVALVTLIASSRLMLIALASAWLLKERHHLLHKLSGAVASMAALGIIFWN